MRLIYLISYFISLQQGLRQRSALAFLEPAISNRRFTQSGYSICHHIVFFFTNVYVQYCTILETAVKDLSQD